VDALISWRSARPLPWRLSFLDNNFITIIPYISINI
jgi:hypothetical protein